MLDDVAQALCHGHRLASRFLPTVGDERDSLGLERCTGAPLEPLDSISSVATQGWARELQGGRDSGRDRELGPANVFCLITATTRWAGGRYRENYMQSLLVLIWRIQFLFRIPDPPRQQSWFWVKASAFPGYHMTLLYAVSLLSAFFLFFFSLSMTSDRLPTQRNNC